MDVREFVYRGEALSFEELVHALPDGEFDRPTCSTLPLLAWWKRGLLPVPIDGRIEVEVEAAVPAHPRPDGRPNTASYTDVMVRSGAAAVAVEGKWTEPRYERVESWLGEVPSANRLAVLGHWLELLAPYCNGQPPFEDMGEVVYQLLHRGASACAQDRPRAELVVQVFGEEHEARYLEDLTTLVSAIRPMRLGVALVVVPLRPTAAWEALSRGEPDRIRRTLVGDDLFHFGEGRVHRVV